MRGWRKGHIKYPDRRSEDTCAELVVNGKGSGSDGGANQGVCYGREDEERYQVRREFSDGEKGR